MMSNKIKDLFARFGGFSIVGGVVTLISMYMLYALVEYLHLNATLAYVISYLVSIQISFFINLRFVFRATFSWRNLLYFNFTYLLGMLLGIGLLRLFIHLAPIGTNEIWLSYAVVFFTLFFNFFFINIILRKNEKTNSK